MAIDPKLTCYAYFDGTYEYISAVQADYDPVVPGNILWPRNTTTVKPPSFYTGTVPIFNPKTKVWAVVPDYRGQIGYDPSGAAVLINQAGDPSTFSPPLTKIPPTPETNLPDPTVPDQNYANRTSKVAFFRRCTDTEAAQFISDLAEASPKLKAIFDSVTYLIPGTDEYPALRGAVEARVSSARADELLAPSND